MDNGLKQRQSEQKETSWKVIAVSKLERRWFGESCNNSAEVWVDLSIVLEQRLVGLMNGSIMETRIDVNNDF